MIQVGSAAVCITPPIGSELSGQFNKRLMTGIHDDLYVKAMVIDDGTNRVALVNCDVLSLKRSTVRTARALITEFTSIPGENVMISATHTHTGPATTRKRPGPDGSEVIFPSGFTTSADSEYVALLPRWIASAVALADQRRSEARIGAGTGREERATFNRRYLARDGSVRMHGAAPDGVEIIGPEGTTDPEVGVLFAEDAAGQLLSAVISYTCHPTSAGHELVASADYCGYLTGTVARARRCTGEVLFINGAFANVGPVGQYSPDRREYGFGRSQYIGTLVGAEALRVIELTEPASDLRVRAATETIRLPIREITDQQLAVARQVLADDKAGIVDRIFAQEALLLAADRRHEPSVPAEVQAIAIGDAAFVGIPAELFVEFGLEIKQRSPIPRTFIAGDTNGMVGYIPTRIAFENGGYEPRLARSSKIIPEGGAMLVDAALGVLTRVAQ